MRRNDSTMRCKAELAIAEAIRLVEAMGSDTRLTTAVVELGEALRQVSDYVDSRVDE